MRKLYGGIVKSKVLVIILFLIAFAVCMADMEASYYIEGMPQD